MDIDNIISIKSAIIKRNIVHTLILSCFFKLLAKKSEIFPKHERYFFISESFALN